MFPLPNAPEGGSLYNYTSQLPRDIPRREDIARVDWQISSRTRLSARYVHNKDEDRQPLGTTTAAFNVPLAASASSARTAPATTFSLTLTHTFSPSLINEFIYGAGRGGVFIGPIDLDDVTRAHAEREHAARSSRARIPTDTVPERPLPGHPRPELPGHRRHQTACRSRCTDFNGTPFDQKFVINNFMNNLTKLTGRHTFKAGLYYQRANNRRTSFGPVQSNLVFGDSNPHEHGPPVRQRAPRHLRHVHPGRAEDRRATTSTRTSRATSRTPGRSRRGLTLDYGLRVSHYQPIYDKEDRLGFFNPELFDPSRAVRLYRPVCVALPCTGANLRAIDPAVTAPPTSPTPGPATTWPRSSPAPAT